MRLTLADGREIEERQPHLRGGRHEALSRADIETKFRVNARFGGWDDAGVARALSALHGCFERPLNFASFRT